MKGDLPYPTPTRLAFADQVAAGRIRWYNFVTPEARHTVTGYKHTSDLAELVTAGLAVVPPCEPGSSSIASLTEAAIPWARSANRREGPGSTSPEPGPRVNLDLGPDGPAECRVCGIHAAGHYAIGREYWPDLTDAERDAVLAHERDELAAGPATKDGA